MHYKSFHKHVNFGVMNSINQFDIIIVGGGPIGLACALEAKKAGLQYCILEKGCLVNSYIKLPY